ncbi:MAG: NAD-dependent deacylase [Pseudomonadota bacterium]
MPDNIVILTGAGISAESGLGTFRDSGGLWSEYDLEDVATPDGFARNPKLVHDFYNARRANCLGAHPNAAHNALAGLETQAPGTVTIVTQNVDDLHERSGCRNVIHMHGELLRALCANCGHRWDAPEQLSTETACPACTASAARPDVVWFGEIPYQMDRIAGLLKNADLFVAIGTSGTVYPAAGFVEEARIGGAKTLELTLDPSEVSHLFHEARSGPATIIVPNWVAELLGG